MRNALTGEDLLPVFESQEDAVRAGGGGGGAVEIRGLRVKAPTVWPPRLPFNFPLTVTKRGYVKTIEGKTRWICGPCDPAEAMRAYHRKAQLLNAAGTKVVMGPAFRADPTTVTMRYIMTEWLGSRHADLEAGRLGVEAYLSYRRDTAAIVSYIADIRAAEVTPTTSADLYQRVAEEKGTGVAGRVMKRWIEACDFAADFELIPPDQNIRLGRKVIAKLLKRDKGPTGMKWKLYSRANVRQILAFMKLTVHRSRYDKVRNQNRQLLAMFLLALNGGYGAAECSQLLKKSVDLKRAVIDQERGKTGSDHSTPLWPETVEALRPLMDLCPDDPHLFRTISGRRIVTTTLKENERGQLDKAMRTDALGSRFRTVTEALGLKIPGQGVYKLKHLANTVANSAKDTDATYTLFGHSLGVKAHYVRVGPERVRKVVEYMRQHLIGRGSDDEINQEEGPRSARSVFAAIRRMKRDSAEGELRRRANARSGQRAGSPKPVPRRSFLPLSSGKPRRLPPLRVTR